MQTTHRNRQPQLQPEKSSSNPPVRPLSLLSSEQPRAPNREEADKPVRSVEELRAFVSRNVREIAAKSHLFCYGSPENAQEVLQELYPRLLKVLQQNPAGIRSPWAAIHCVAARLAIDEFRKRSRRKRSADLPANDALPASVSAGRFVADDIKALRDALVRLNPRLQYIIQGVFIDGRKAKDIASDMELSEARIAELKQQALRELRTILVPAP